MTHTIVTDEVHDPVEAVRLMQVQPIRYAPGDATLYRCSMIQLDPRLPDRAVVMMVQIDASKPQTIVLREPNHYDRWDAARWQRENLPEGWYGAAIALLGALGWTKVVRHTYDSLAFREFE